MMPERKELWGGYYVRSSGKVEQDRWALCRPDGVVISYERGRSPNEFKTFAAAMSSATRPDGGDSLRDIYTKLDTIRCLQTQGRTGREVADQMCSEVKAALTSTEGKGG